MKKSLSTMFVLGVIISFGLEVTPIFSATDTTATETTAKQVCQKNSEQKVACYRAINRCKKLTDKTKKTKCWQDLEIKYKTTVKKPTRLKPTDFKSSLLETSKLLPKCANGNNLVNNKCNESNVSNNCNWGISTKNIEKNTYKQITLTNTIGNVFTKNEVIVLKGQVSLSQVPDITAFISDKNGKITNSFVSKNTPNGFTIPVTFNQAGSFYLTIIPGTNGSNTVFPITVNELNCSKSLTSESSVASDLKWEIINNQVVFKWNTEANLSRITISQNNQIVYKIIDQKQNQWVADPVLFEKFIAGNAFFMVETANSSTGFALDQNTAWGTATYQIINLINHHFSEISSEGVIINNIPVSFNKGDNITLIGKVLVNANLKALVVTPNKGVKELELTSTIKSQLNSLTKASVLPANSDFTFNYKTESAETHIIEINADTGAAIINIPVYENGKLPLLPDYNDLRTFKSISYDSIASLETEFFNSINVDRVKNGLKEIKRDDALNNLAKARANDMVKDNYLAHYNSQGIGANELRSYYSVKSMVSENIALDYSPYYAEAGLMRSAGHRANILKPEWTRVGVGIVAKNEQFVFVQLFASDELSLKSTADLRTEILNSLNQVRSSKFILNEKLNTIAQGWTTSMINDNFLDFKNPITNENLLNNPKIGEITSSAGAYIFSNSSFEDLKLKLAEVADLKSTTYKQIGLGIAQDNQGIIKLTIIYY